MFIRHGIKLLFPVLQTWYKFKKNCCFDRNLIFIYTSVFWLPKRIKKIGKIKIRIYIHRSLSILKESLTRHAYVVFICFQPHDRMACKYMNYTTRFRKLGRCSIISWSRLARGFINSICQWHVYGCPTAECERPIVAGWSACDVISLYQSCLKLLLIFVRHMIELQPNV